MASATAPSTTKPAPGAATKMPTACAGFNAASTPGALAIWNTPLTARTANHKTISGPKRRPTRSGAALLNQKKCEQHNDRQRQDKAVQHRRRNADAFDGAEHGNCRCDHTVAVE